MRSKRKRKRLFVTNGQALDCVKKCQLNLCGTRVITMYHNYVRRLCNTLQFAVDCVMDKTARWTLQLNPAQLSVPFCIATLPNSHPNSIKVVMLISD